MTDSEQHQPEATAKSRKPNLLKSTFSAGSMTMLSRITGLGRDLLQTHFLGASAVSDAFVIAFKIPNFFRRLFAEGAFSQSFVPVFAEYRQHRPVEELKALIDRVSGCLGISLVVLSTLGVLGAPILAMVFGLGYLDEPEKLANLTSLIRIMFPYVMLISLSGLMGAILNSYDRFAVTAFTPVLLNLVSISAMFMAVHLGGPVEVALAWSVLVAGVLSMLFQMPHLKQLNMLPSPTIDWKDPGVRKIMTLMVPALFAVSISQINTLLDSNIATMLGDGAPTWLYVSDRLVEFPLGIFGVALGTVIMPSLSRLHIDESGIKFSTTLDWSIKMVGLIALPATLALVILAEPIILTLFQHGEFSTFAAQMSSYSLKAYVLGLFGFMLIKVLAPGYFARHDMKTPAKIGVIAIAAGMGLKLLMVYPLQSFWAVGHVGLALSTAMAAYVNAALLYRGLRKAGVYQPNGNWIVTWGRYFVANSVMALALLVGLHYLSGWVEWSIWTRFLNLMLLCTLGMLAYALGLLLAGFRPSDFKAPQ